MSCATYHRETTQRNPGDPYWPDNCTAYVAGDLIADATVGGVIVDGEWVRAHSDEPVPDHGSPGLNIQQVAKVMRSLHVGVTDRTGESFATLTHRVGQHGSHALAQIDYATLGSYRAQANGDFGHAIKLIKFNATYKQVYAFDPLAKVARWYPASVIKAAMLKFAHDTGITNGGVRYAVIRVTPDVCA